MNIVTFQIWNGILSTHVFRLGGWGGGWTANQKPEMLMQDQMRSTIEIISEKCQRNVVTLMTAAERCRHHAWAVTSNSPVCSLVWRKSTLQELKLSKPLQPDIQQRFVLVKKQHLEARASPVSPSLTFTSNPQFWSDQWMQNFEN